MLFAPGLLTPLRQECAQPHWIYASGTLTSGSLRSQQTVQPLGEKLGLAVNTSFNPSKKQDPGIPREADLIEEVLTKSGVVLISWQHEFIPLLAALILRNSAPTLTPQWSADCFDLIWVFNLDVDSDPYAPRYRFVQVPQELLAGDRGLSLNASGTSGRAPD